MYSSSTSESVQSCTLSPSDQLTTVASSGRASVQVAAGTLAEVQTKIGSDHIFVMAAIHYGSATIPPLDGPALNINVPLETISSSPNIELWYCNDAVQHGTLRGVSYARSNDALFGYISMPQAAEPLEHTAQRAYTQLLAAINELQYPHLLRVWNYFAAINADEKGMERYQRFCVGRQRAFEEHYRNYMIEHLPAASAIGTRDSDLIVYFLAARNGGQHLDNPRQTRAYYYPKQYGPCSPAFSRATMKQWATGSALYLSGTASIVGHESLHLNDAAGQTRETMENIRALFAAAPSTQRAPWSKAAALLKIYARDAKDAETVRALAQQEFGESVPLLILQGDICRRELLLEIEGVYQE